LSDRMAYWLDYEHPYVTYTNEYIESVWWLLKQLFEKGLLFQGPKVLPYCIRCGTALSSHELALGYDTHRSPSIHVLLKLRSGQGVRGGGGWVRHQRRRHGTGAHRHGVRRRRLRRGATRRPGILQLCRCCRTVSGNQVGRDQRQDGVRGESRHRRASRAGRKN